MYEYEELSETVNTNLDVILRGLGKAHSSRELIGNYARATVH